MKRHVNWSLWFYYVCSIVCRLKFPLSPPLLILLIPQVTDRPQEEEVVSKTMQLRAREMGGRGQEDGGAFLLTKICISRLYNNVLLIHLQLISNHC